MSPSIRIAALAALVCLPLVAQAEDAVRWAPNLEAAKRAASARNQLVMIHFWADNCPPCHRLDANVFSQPQFAGALEQNYVPVKINASRDPQLAQEYGVDRWPQDVIITPSGQVVYRMISPQEVDRYTDILDQVASKMNPTSASPAMVAQAGNTMPVSAPVGPTIEMGQAQAAPSQGSRYSRFSGDQPAPPAAQVTPSTPSLETTPAPTSRFASSGPAPQAPPASRPQSSFVGAAPPSAPQSSFVQPQMPGPGQPAQGHPQPGLSASTPEGNTPSAQPHSAPEQPKFAMDGFCPVTLVEQMKWQKGDPQWGAVHQGQVYLFSSQLEQQKFLADPNRFSPVMSGIDPVAYLGSGQVVPGDRRFGLTYQGTLYLFSSEESLQQFWNEPQRYSAMVRQAMDSQNMRR